MRTLILILFCFTVLRVQAQQDTIKTPSGLKYLVVKKGTGVQPVKGQKVKVHYVGRLESGKIFDTSRNAAGAFRFTIGAQEVIPGWDEGLTLMHVGEVGTLIVPPNLAYGHRGVPDSDNPDKYLIPPDAELTFELELLSVK